ncbi:hypothetical protein SPRG_16231 [Saprolegnia parasitica CBS 223.65]|uniref:Uncharacterized protein n=1 Tax=Saprolegnia parasitica (strain CBS 223.65) TaxID=695850 RepID=A0A067BVL8_SAPPC|nr:hypothetical protein SPRG_16231 [Saprolegnia parasitica CBS 223.65]KDO18331.1 hypothetical protein SPRG_16231 [Saprolegnia parasitica CBS 223.65]|eukprot:XP_012210957.1 hypothetical protein SPRG_16231 [Saprolegnia parasitica CBS 223.65]
MGSRRNEPAGVASHTDGHRSSLRRSRRHDSIEKPPLFFAWQTPAPSRAPPTTPAADLEAPRLAAAPLPTTAAPPSTSCQTVVSSPPSVPQATLVMPSPQPMLQPAVVLSTQSMAPTYVQPPAQIMYPCMYYPMATPVQQASTTPATPPIAPPVAPAIAPPLATAAQREKPREKAVYPPGMPPWSAVSSPPELLLPGKSTSEASEYWIWLHWYASWQLYYEQGREPSSSQRQSRRLAKLMASLMEKEASAYRASKRSSRAPAASTRSRHVSKAKSSHGLAPPADVWWLDVSGSRKTRHRTKHTATRSPETPTPAVDTSDAILTLEELAI